MAVGFKLCTQRPDLLHGQVGSKYAEILHAAGKSVESDYLRRRAQIDITLLIFGF